MDDTIFIEPLSDNRQELFNYFNMPIAKRNVAKFEQAYMSNFSWLGFIYLLKGEVLIDPQ